MLRIQQRIFTGNIELVKTDIVQKHIDSAKVVGGDIDFLPKVALPDSIFAQNALRFQQQRAGAASRVIHLVDLL